MAQSNYLRRKKRATLPENTFVPQGYALESMPGNAMSPDMLSYGDLPGGAMSPANRYVPVSPGGMDALGQPTSDIPAPVLTPMQSPAQPPSQAFLDLVPQASRALMALRGPRQPDPTLFQHTTPAINPMPEQPPIEANPMGGGQIAGENQPMGGFEAPAVTVTGSPITDGDYYTKLNYANAGGPVFPDRSTHVDTQQGFGSPTALALLSAGLGILANNTGHYGQFGPAVGRGGLQGISTFMQLKQMQQQDEQARQKMALEQARQGAYLKQVEAQTMAQTRANDTDMRKQALIRNWFETADPKEKQAYLERLMLESGQYPQYERSIQASQKQPPIKEIGVGKDDQGNDLVQKAIVQPDGSYVPVGQPTRKHSLVDVNIAGEKAFSQKYGAKEAEAAGAITEQADKAFSTMQTTDTILDYARKWQAQGGQLGRFANAQAFFSNFMQSSGINPGVFGLPPDAGPAEALNAVNRELIVNKIGSGGFPANNFSNADRQFLEGMKPNLNDTPTGFVLKLMAERAIARRSIDKDRLWQDALDASGGDEQAAYRSFRRQWREYANSKSAFTDVERQEMANLLREMNPPRGSQNQESAPSEPTGGPILRRRYVR